jgi:predicted MPP superfamily phosphohydrolase
MNKVSRRTFIWGGIGLITSVTAIDAFWYEKVFIELNEYYLGNASPGGSNLKVLQISDLHLRRIQPKHLELAALVNRIKPELILFTGDVIDQNKSLKNLDKYLALFDPAIQKTAILGNWECWKVHPLELLDVYKKHDCELIVNHSFLYTFGKTTISVSGMDDLVAGKADFNMAMEFYQKSDYHVVMTHCPQHRDIIKTQMKDIPIDLVISGHTHGGQLNLFGFAPFRPYGSGRYVSGWYREELPHLYVSRGIGTSGVPIRLGSRAEVTVFNFERRFE